MKFKTSDLITRIDNLLRDLEGKCIQAAEEHDENLEGSRDAWMEDFGTDFRQFAGTIYSRLNAGKPVTRKDIPDSIMRNGDLKVYYEPSLRLTAENRQYDNLMKLKAALSSSTEEAVSPSAIKQLGFQDVTFLFTPEAAA